MAYNYKVPLRDQLFLRPEQRQLLTDRLVDENSPAPDPNGAAVLVEPRPQPGVVFQSRTSSSSLQVLGRSDRVGGMLHFDFDHTALCGSHLKLTASGESEFYFQLDRGEDPPVILQVDTPWAVDASGRELPTWFEADGTTLRQVVDASAALAPVLFDPTYTSMNCSSGHYSALNAAQYLDQYSPNTDYGYCSVREMFLAANGYLPVWGFETNIANDYGLIPLREGGACSSSPDTGPAWDFQVPCKAHDYCYDLRKAGFSGTVTDQGCDDAFYWLMEAHCNDRVFAGDCRDVRDSYYFAVTRSGVVTDPNPGVVSIYNLGSYMCADVEGPAAGDDTPIQQWSCLNTSNQRYRVWPSPGAPGLFQFRPEWITGKCVDAWNWVTQWTCGEYSTQRFRIQGALGDC